MISVFDGDRERRARTLGALRDGELTALAAEDSTADTEAALTLYCLAAQPAMHEALAEFIAASMVPVVAMIARDGDTTVEAAFRAGAADVVFFDTSADELCARIRARLWRQRALDGLERRNHGARMVLELTQALSSELDIREILALLVKRVAEVVDVDRVSIVLGGQEDDTAYVIAASDDERLRDLPIKLSDYPEIGKVFETSDPVVIHDTVDHPLYELAQRIVPKRFRSVFLIPILFEDRPMGVLFLRNERPGKLAEQDLFLLSALANATGIALRNARLLQSLREQSRQNRFAHYRAESQLKVLQRYMDFFDSSADGIVVVAPEGRVLFCNPAACVITGRDPDELRNGDFVDVLCDDNKERFARLKEKFAEGAFSTNVDLAINTKNGERRVLNVSVNSMLHEDKSVIISLRDVTDERALGRELAKTKEFLQCVIDSSVDAIVSADMAGVVKIFNPAAERIYGYQADEVIDKLNVRELYPPDRAFEIMRYIRSDDYGGGGVLQGYEAELLGKGGQAIPVRLSASLILHRQRPIGSVGVFKDLRATRQIEARLAKTQEQLEIQEKKAVVAELAGATAHELNQPLTTIMGYVEMLLRQTEKDSRYRRVSEAIMRETERMAEIVRKIGKLTKYETKPYVGQAKIIDIDRSIDSEPPAV